MATPELPLGHLDEGRAYLESVQKLGLRPHAFFWAFDRVTSSFVLVLITEAFDVVGPFELSKLLFKAYNAHATPRSIDPFMIRLHSTEHQVVREMDKIMPSESALGATASGDGREGACATRAIVTVDGLDIYGDWVYLYDKPMNKRLDSTAALRRFHRFARTIEKIAA